MMWFFFVILGLMLALDLVWWWYADRLIRPLSRARLWRGLLAAFMAAQVFLIFWSLTARSLGPGFDQLTPRAMIAGTYLWHLIALPLIGVLLTGVGVITVARWLATRVLGEHIAHRRGDVIATLAVGTASDLALEPRACVAPSRRQFLGAAVAAAPPVLTAGAVGFSARTLDRFRVRRLDVVIPDLSRDLAGLTIAHVTDIHVGRFTDGPQLRKIVEETNKLRADLPLAAGQPVFAPSQADPA